MQTERTTAPNDSINSYRVKFHIGKCSALKWVLWLVRRALMIQQMVVKMVSHHLWQSLEVISVHRLNFVSLRQVSTEMNQSKWPIRWAMQYLRQPIFHQLTHQICMKILYVLCIMSIIKIVSMGNWTFQLKIRMKMGWQYQSNVLITK